MVGADTSSHTCVPMCSATATAGHLLSHARCSFIPPSGCYLRRPPRPCWLLARQATLYSTNTGGDAALYMSLSYLPAVPRTPGRWDRAWRTFRPPRTTQRKGDALVRENVAKKSPGLASVTRFTAPSLLFQEKKRTTSRNAGLIDRSHQSNNVECGRHRVGSRRQVHGVRRA